MQLEAISYISIILFDLKISIKNLILDINIINRNGNEDLLNSPKNNHGINNNLDK